LDVVFGIHTPVNGFHIPSRGIYTPARGIHMPSDGNWMPVRGNWDQNGRKRAVFDPADGLERASQPGSRGF